MIYWMYVAVLDVRMTETLPPRMTASTGMDALCHAIEAYTCLQKIPVSDAYAAKANASMMAGAAFSNSMVGIIRGIGHALGGVCHIPHGDAMTILLPHGMAYNYHQCKDLYGELLLSLAGDVLFILKKAY